VRLPLAFTLSFSFTFSFAFPLAQPTLRQSLTAARTRRSAPARSQRAPTAVLVVELGVHAQQTWCRDEGVMAGRADRTVLLARRRRCSKRSCCCRGIGGCLRWIDEGGSERDGWHEGGGDTSSWRRTSCADVHA
jgi:hypothetical protein